MQAPSPPPPPPQCILSLQVWLRTGDIKTQASCCPCIMHLSANYSKANERRSASETAVPDHVTFLNQVTYSGNLVQTELPIERKPNQITFGWTVLPSPDSPVFPHMGK